MNSDPVRTTIVALLSILIGFEYLIDATRLYNAISTQGWISSFYTCCPTAAPVHDVDNQ